MGQVPELDTLRAAARGAGARRRDRRAARLAVTVAHLSKIVKADVSADDLVDAGAGRVRAGAQRAGASRAERRPQREAAQATGSEAVTTGLRLLPSLNSRFAVSNLQTVVGRRVRAPLDGRGHGRTAVVRRRAAPERMARARAKATQARATAKRSSATWRRSLAAARTEDAVARERAPLRRPRRRRRSPGSPPCAIARACCRSPNCFAADAGRPVRVLPSGCVRCRDPGAPPAAARHGRLAMNFDTTLRSAARLALVTVSALTLASCGGGANHNRRRPRPRPRRERDRPACDVRLPRRWSFRRA